MKYYLILALLAYTATGALLAWFGHKLVKFPDEEHASYGPFQMRRGAGRLMQVFLKLIGVLVAAGGVFCIYLVLKDGV